MKTRFLLSVLLVATLPLASFRFPLVVRESDLVGEWQLGLKILGSNKRATYAFTANKTFIYMTDGQDALIEVLNIRGTYSLKKILSTSGYSPSPSASGKLSKNLYTPINDSWEVTGGAIKTIKLISIPYYPLIIKVISIRKILETGGSLYYKI